MKGCESRNKGCKVFAVWNLFEVDEQKSQACLRLCGSLEMKGMCLKRK